MASTRSSEWRWAAINVKVRAAIVHDGKVLVAEESRRGEEILTLPGGRPKDGESLEDALRREVREETGLDVRVGDLRFVAEVVAPFGLHDLVLVFRAEAAGLDPSAVTLLARDDRRLADVRPPIVDRVLADAADEFSGRPRWLGNVHDPRT